MSAATGIAAAAAAAAVPAEVRREGAAAVRGFRAALEFESMLLKQLLSEALPESPTGTSAAEEGGEGAPVPTLASLPETVAAAVVGAGGLGLAGEMYGSFAGAGG